MLGAAVAATLLLALAACTPPTPPDPQEPVVSTFEALGAPHVEPALVALRWKVSDPQEDDLTCRLDGDGDGTWDLTLDPCPSDASRNATSVVAGSHTARLEVSDGSESTVATTTYAVAAPTSTEDFDIEIRPAGPMDADVVAAFEAAAARWEDAIVRGLSDLPVAIGAGSCGTNSAGLDEVVDDLVVEVSMVPYFPYAAWAAPCVYGPDDLPRYGFVEVNSVTLDGVRSAGTLDELTLHELGHVLGFGVVWQFGRDLVAGAAGVDPRFSGPRALAEYSALGRSGGIPIMTIDGAWQPHWESAFFEEVMARVPDGAPLSRMTIASMADLGYAVDLDAADPYTPELPAGTCIDFGGGVVRCW